MKYINRHSVLGFLTGTAVIIWLIASLLTLFGCGSQKYVYTGDEGFGFSSENYCPTCSLLNDKINKANLAGHRCRREAYVDLFRCRSGHLWKQVVKACEMKKRLIEGKITLATGKQLPPSLILMTTPI